MMVKRIYQRKDLENNGFIKSRVRIYVVSQVARPASSDYASDLKFIRDVLNIHCISMFKIRLIKY